MLKLRASDGQICTEMVCAECCALAVYKMLADATSINPEWEGCLCVEELTVRFVCDDAA